MANFDDFVKSHFFRDQIEDCFGGFGSALIINDTCCFQDVGMGIFAEIKSVYEEPVLSHESRQFQFIRQRCWDDYRLFQNDNTVGQAIASGIIGLVPDANTYKTIKETFNILSEQLLILLNVLEELRGGEFNYEAEIKHTVTKINSAKNPEELTKYIMQDCAQFGFLVYDCIGNWIEHQWFMEKPPEYAPMIEAYEPYMFACIEGDYTLTVGSEMKNRILINTVSHIGDVSITQSNLIITDTPEEIKALADLNKHQNNYDKKPFDTAIKERNILYRGAVEAAAESIKALSDRDNIVICENIRGPKEYRAYCNRS